MMQKQLGEIKRILEGLGQLQRSVGICEFAQKQDDKTFLEHKQHHMPESIAEINILTRLFSGNQLGETQRLKEFGAFVHEENND